MSNNKIQIQLKGNNQISGTDLSPQPQGENGSPSKIKVTIKKKIAIATKPPQAKPPQAKPNLPLGMIDLKNYYNESKLSIKSSGKTLVIDVLGRLVEHTEDKIKQTTGEERKKHQFRSSQFRKAIATLQSHPFEIVSGAQAKQLDGIGKGIADRIDEILKTGTLAELNENVSIDEKTKIINELTTVTGIGESHAKKFVEQGVTSLEDLREKAKKGIIKLTHHMQVGLNYYYDFQKKIPYDEIVSLSKIMKEAIDKVHPGLLVEVCGSHRRKRPLSGDIDVLITNPNINSEDEIIKSQVHYLKDIVKCLREIQFIIDDLTSQGDTKYMGVCMHTDNKIGRRIDIRFVPYDSYYPALLYFTGSMMTNKLMRTIALEKGYTLNEYGLYRFIDGKKGEKIVVQSEKEIFDILSIIYLDPTEREI